MAPIEVSNLTKKYGDVLANDDLTFDVEAGEVFGYLGPNGAGKTTTIRTLLGLQSPTEGTATVLGADVRDGRALVEAKHRIGYLPAELAFDEAVSGREILDLHAAIKGDERREELLSTFDPPLDRRVREYSSGNRQMLGIVQAFMHDPDLVVLDEPTGGLDPLKQQAFNEFLRAERDAGTTVFMSSHVLSEVRRVCDRVGVIRDGRLVTTESVEDLLRRSGKVVRIGVADSTDGLDVAGVHDLSIREVERETVGDGTGTVTEFAFTYTGDVNHLIDRIGGFDVVELDIEEAPIEDVFMQFYDESSVSDTGSSTATDDASTGTGTAPDENTAMSHDTTGGPGEDTDESSGWEWTETEDG